MSYIICEPCVSTCDTACLEVCPVDCIHGPENSLGSGLEARSESFKAENKMLYINPDLIHRPWRTAPLGGGPRRRGARGTLRTAAAPTAAR